MVEQTIHEDDGTWRLKIFRDGHWQVRFQPLDKLEVTVSYGHFEDGRCVKEYGAKEHPKLPSERLKSFVILARFISEGN